MLHFLFNRKTLKNHCTHTFQHAFRMCQGRSSGCDRCLTWAAGPRQLETPPTPLVLGCAFPAPRSCSKDTAFIFILSISVMFIRFSYSYPLKPLYLPLWMWCRFSSSEVWATRNVSCQLVRILILKIKNPRLRGLKRLIQGHTVGAPWTQVWNPFTLCSQDPHSAATTNSGSYL